MSTHNICFHGEIKKISAFFRMKKAPYLLLCVQYSFIAKSLLSVSVERMCTSAGWRLRGLSLPRKKCG